MLLISMAKMARTYLIASYCRKRMPNFAECYKVNNFLSFGVVCIYNAIFRTSPSVVSVRYCAKYIKIAIIEVNEIATIRDCLDLGGVVLLIEECRYFNMYKFPKRKGSYFYFYSQSLSPIAQFQRKISYFFMSRLA